MAENKLKFETKLNKKYEILGRLWRFEYCVQTGVYSFHDPESDIIIHATPGFEDVDLPIEMSTVEGEVLLCDELKPKPETFQKYYGMVKNHVESKINPKILNKNRIKKQEIEILKDEIFIKRLINYAHKDKDERMYEAYHDTFTTDVLDEFTYDMKKICHSIMEAGDML